MIQALRRAHRGRGGVAGLEDRRIAWDRRRFVEEPEGRHPNLATVG
jgi:hypothetical protein